MKQLAGAERQSSVSVRETEGLLLSWGGPLPKPGFILIETAGKVRRNAPRPPPQTHTPQHIHTILVGSLKWIPAALLFLLVGSADSLLCARLCVCSCPSKDWCSVVGARFSVCICVFPATWLTKRAGFFPPFPVHHGAVQPLLAELHSHGKKLREGAHQWVHQPFLVFSLSSSFFHSSCLSVQ